MKHIYSLVIIILIAASCSSVKRSTSSLLRGNYDQAIYNSLNRIRKNPSKKKRDNHIMLLEEAFAKATQRDNERINFFKKQGQSSDIEKIYKLYIGLNKRQEALKPLLPLELVAEQRTATFKIKNYDSEIICYKKELVELLYSEAIYDIKVASLKQDYRKVHTNLKELNDLHPNYKNVPSLLNETHSKGTDYIEVALFNDSQIALPKQLEKDLLDFTTYDINEFWKEYHSTKQQGVNYDYVMDVSIRQINISPERVQERQLVKEKSIIDGTEFLKDDKGNFILDEEGNKQEVDRYINVTSEYYESLQSKAVNIVGQVRYNNKATGQLVESFPLTSEYIFEHYYATYNGDKRALDNVSLGYTNNRAVPFPTNEQMVFDVGEDLKQRLKSIFVNSSL